MKVVEAFTNYSQQKLIAKLNHYLQQQGRENKLAGGQCNGLTMLWLYKMSQGQSSWLHQMVRNINNTPDHKLLDIEIIIEKLLNHLLWIQKPNKVQHSINQTDFDETMGLMSEYSNAFVFSHKQLIEELTLVAKERRLIHLSNHKHAIGLFYQDGVYHLYDANYPDRSIQLKSIESVVSKIGISLKVKSHARFGLTINVWNNPEVKNMPIATYPSALDRVRTLVEDQQTSVNELALYKEPAQAYVGYSPLYLAAANGQDDVVQYLLEQGANPLATNGPFQKTALHVAAEKGYYDVCKRLIKNSPQLAGIKNSLGNVPLEFAKLFHHDDIVQLLAHQVDKYEYLMLWDLLEEQNQQARSYHDFELDEQSLPAILHRQIRALRDEANRIADEFGGMKKSLVIHTIADNLDSALRTYLENKLPGSSCFKQLKTQCEEILSNETLLKVVAQEHNVKSILAQFVMAILQYGLLNTLHVAVKEGVRFFTQNSDSYRLISEVRVNVKNATPVGLAF